MSKINDKVQAIGEQFPLLAEQRAQESPLVFLDNASTTQKPQRMLDAMNEYYCYHNANPSRGVYRLGKDATKLYEDARAAVAQFIKCDSEEVVFTAGATEALNLVAYSYGTHILEPGDEIVIPVSEHHSNLVPWQRVAELTKAHITYIYPDKNGQIKKEIWETTIGEKTKIVAVAHVSNVLGSVACLKTVADIAHKAGAVVVADCAQSVAHLPLDLHALGVDFAAFSGHKIYGPMGIGVLYGRRALLREMSPLMRGGGIVDAVFQNRTKFVESPACFEAGTPNVAASLGLVEAIRFIESIGWDAIREHEGRLLKQLLSGIKAMPEVEVYGHLPSVGRDKELACCGVVAFNVKGINAYDVAEALDRDNIVIRAGTHCAEPLVRFLGVRSTCRVSLALYNTEEDVDRFLEAVEGVKRRVMFMVLSTMH